MKLNVNTQKIKEITFFHLLPAYRSGFLSPITPYNSLML